MVSFRTADAAQHSTSVQEGPSVGPAHCRPSAHGLDAVVAARFPDFRYGCEILGWVNLQLLDGAVFCSRSYCSCSNSCGEP